MPKVISIKLPCNFIEISFRHVCSPVNLLHIFRTPFPKNTSRGLLMSVENLPDFEKLFVVMVSKINLNKQKNFQIWQ